MLIVTICSRHSWGLFQPLGNPDCLPGFVQGRSGLIQGIRCLSKILSFGNWKACRMLGITGLNHLNRKHPGEKILDFRSSVLGTSQFSAVLQQSFGFRILPLHPSFKFSDPSFYFDWGLRLKGCATFRSTKRGKKSIGQEGKGCVIL